MEYCVAKVTRKKKNKNKKKTSKMLTFSELLQCNDINETYSILRSKSYS